MGKNRIDQSLTRAFNGEGDVPIDGALDIWNLRSRYIREWVAENSLEISDQEKSDLLQIADISLGFVNKFYGSKDKK